MNSPTKTKQSGTVKWFDDNKGYGFIEADDEDIDEDVFVHFSAIVSADSYKQLDEDESVTFEVQKTPEGLKATNVRRQ